MTSSENPRTPSRAPKFLVVSLHDIHPDSLPLIRQQVETLASWGVPRASLLLVPEFHHGRSLENAPGLRAAVNAWIDAGHEPVLHGYYHDRQDRRDSPKDLFWTRVYTSREAEFLDLDDDDARNRINRGLDLFARLGWKPRGFIAPAWLMTPCLPDLLWELGFSYTNTLRFFHAAHGSPLTAHSLCYSTRAAWRRTTSRLWNRLLYRRVREAPLLRLSLHPNDLTFPALRRQIEAIVRQALADGHEPVTYAEFVQTHFSSPAVFR